MCVDILCVKLGGKLELLDDWRVIDAEGGSGRARTICEVKRVLLKTNFEIDPALIGGEIVDGRIDESSHCGFATLSHVLSPARAPTCAPSGAAGLPSAGGGDGADCEPR